jgi:hypothetical protein
MLRAPMKRSVALLSILAGLTASIRVGLRHAEDARNVSRLQARFGLGEQEAKGLYRLARTEGFGYAAQRLLRDRRKGPEEDGSKQD